MRVHDHSAFKYLTAIAIISTGLFFTWQFFTPREETLAPRIHGPDQSRDFSQIPSVSCSGPSGEPVSSLTGDALPNTPIPPPTYGSFDALQLPKTWMTFNQRYSPYGFGNETRSEFLHKADWGRLQTKCFEKNQRRFPGQRAVTVLPPRFRPVHWKAVQDPPASTKTNRQAIVIRTWSTYNYQDEDLWNLRSIVTEASLATGGEYQVFLLVDVKKEQSRMHEDDAEYERILRESLPEEFQSMAVLWHPTLLESWYKKTLEHRSFWQIMQPFQLFAHFFPEFDHYWQFEMDTRFSGDVGQLLRSGDKFGRQEPYKQARERASWTYMQSAHSTYEDFSKTLNKTLQGSATIWGPIKNKKIKPVGTRPPVKTAKDDNFEWGVGTDADLLLTGPLNDVRRFETDADWVFRGWYYGLPKGIPRFMSVPAQARASWELLEAIHLNQHRQGIRIASEATLPSFALWHGLKVVSLPLPKYQYPERDLKELNFVQNGGKLSDFADGIANGPGKYRSSSLNFFSRPLTWDWWSNLNDPILERWQGVEKSSSNDFDPPFMVEVNGSVYMPSLIMHPRKTSHYRAPEK